MFSKTTKKSAEELSKELERKCITKSIWNRNWKPKFEAQLCHQIIWYRATYIIIVGSILFVY